MSKSAEEQVLSGILSYTADDKRMSAAVLQLKAHHFLEPYYKKLFTMASMFYSSFGQVPSRQSVAIMLKRKQTTSNKEIPIGQYLDLFDRFSSTDVDRSDFLFAIDELKHEYAKRSTLDIIEKSRLVISHELVLEDGKTRLSGHEDARSFVKDGFAEIERETSTDISPGGKVSDELLEIQELYNEAEKTKDEITGVKCGIPDVDILTRGFNLGDLIVVPAYSNTGKSHFAVQTVWNAVFEQGKNVIYFTSETVRNTVRRRLLSRHSRHPKFEIPNGIDSNDIKAGTLTPEMKDMYFEVAQDFTSSNYGNLAIQQFPRGATISYIEGITRNYQKEFEISLIVVDPAYWLDADRNRASSREEYASVMKDLKQLSVSYNNGQGLAIMTPWQVSRTSWELAKNAGKYTTAALSETAEATNSADTIIPILNTEEFPEGRYHDMLTQLAKQRDGQTAHSLSIKADLATSYFYQDVTRFGSHSGMVTSNASQDGQDIVSRLLAPF